MLNYSQTKEIIFRLDKDEELLSFRWRGYSLYLIFRFQIEMSLYSPVSEMNGHKKSKLIKVKDFLSAARHNLKNGIYHFLNRNKARIIREAPVIISNYYNLTYEAMKKREYVNYSDIMEFLKQNNNKINYLVFSGPSKIPIPEYADVMCIYRRPVLFITSIERKKISAFVRYLHVKHGIDVSSKYEHFCNSLKHTRFLVDHTIRLLRGKNIPLIFGISCYTEPWMLIAADLLKKKFVELQHGPILPDLTYYQASRIYPKEKKSLLFPDYLLTLGSDWLRILRHYNFIWNSSNSFTVGSKVYQEYKKKDETFNAGSCDILVLSQHGIYGIYNEVKRFLDLYGSQLKEQFRFFVRPHPLEEIENWKPLIDQYSSFVFFSDKNSEHLYSSLIGKAMVIGGTSTGLYEALAFGKRVFIPAYWEKYNVPGVFETFNSSEELYSKLVSGAGKQKLHEFLSPFAGEALKKISA